MTEPKFMPGPYNAAIEDHPVCDTGDWYTSYVVFTEKNGKDVAVAAVAIDDDHDEATATTHLLAAAPEMYDMLAFILEFVENGGNEGEIRECYAEAIAKILRKARGEE